MPLLLLCLGTILASSCQPSSSPPPSSGSVVAAWPHLFTRSMTVHMPFYAVALAPSPSESGHETWSSPSAALRPARQRTPSLAARVATQTAGFAPRRPCRNQAGLIFRPVGFFAFFSGADMRRSPNRFPSRGGGFCMPGTGGAFTASIDAVPVPTMGTAKEVGPLTSSPSSRGQSLGGALWRAAYAPGDGQTSRAYPINPVKYLCISCYITANKPVLSHLLLHLLPQCQIFYWV
jgi:hypothetical protein